MRFWSTVLVVAAPTLLGGATGLLTGQTGADATVVAALLPAVLTAVGGGLLAFKLKKDSETWTSDFIVASGAVALFSFALVVGLYTALYVNAYAGYRDWTDTLERKVEEREFQRKTYADIVEFRRRALEECSKNEAFVNAGREVLGLEPLPWSVFCDIDALNAAEVGASD